MKRNGLMVLLAIILSLAPASRAQDFSETLEAELDNLENGTADFENSDMVPLEESTEPPPKKTKASAPTAPLDPITEPDIFDAPPEIDLESDLAAEPARTEPAPTEPSPPMSAQESLAPPSDEPNSAFEERLSQIYSSNSEPVSSEKWSGLLGARAAESYSVQAGDTLWDLSQTLFADGFYWSKLWAENPEIQNPHKISKGQALRFIGGTEASPPEVRVVMDTPVDSPNETTLQLQTAFEKEDIVVPLAETPASDLQDIDFETVRKMSANTLQQGLNQAPLYREDIDSQISQADLDAGVVVEQSEIVPRPVLPPPSETRRKVLLDLPGSFREFRPKSYERTVTIQRRASSAEKNSAAVVLPQLAFENVPEPMGTVVEVDSGEVVASIGQYVYIRANEPLVLGSKMYSMTPGFEVRSKEAGRVGSVIEVGGTMRILSKIDEKESLYRAQIVYAVNPVRVGSGILMGEPPRVRMTTKGRRLSAELNVIAGGDSETRRYFGDGTTVYLDTKDSGVQVGDVLSIQARRGLRKTTLAPDQKTPIGILKVYSVSGKVASAVVVLATEEVRVGDTTGGVFPERLPDLSIEPPRITSSSEGGADSGASVR